jgi:hypothetical protein
VVIITPFYLSSATMRTNISKREPKSFQQEGVFWSNFGQLERVADIFIHKRYMRYSIITLFVVIAFVGVPRTTIFVIL